MAVNAEKYPHRPRRDLMQKMWFYKRMRGIPSADHAGSDRIFRENGNKRETLILHIRKRQLIFLGEMRNEGKENLILTGRTDGTRDRGKKSITYLTILCKLMVDRDFRRDMKNTKFINTGQGNLEGYNRQGPEGELYIPGSIWRLRPYP